MDGGQYWTWLHIIMQESFELSWHVGACNVAYQHPAVETDAKGQVNSWNDEQSPEPLQQQEHKADLEDVGVEHHQQDDDHAE